MSATDATRVSDVVHRELREAIIGGRLAAGDPIPAERQLAEHHGVNRHAVREALKRLQQAGLVVISHGGPTRVRDWRTEGGLELLLDLAGSTDAPPELVRSVLELRALIGADAARRFCERATPQEREAAADAADAVVAVLVELGTRLGSASVGDGGVGRASGGGDADGGAAAGGHGDDEASVAPAAGDVDASEVARVNAAMAVLWSQLVDGAGNVAYRLALNSLMATMAAVPRLARAVVPHDPDALPALAVALRAGDGEAAARIAGWQLGADVEAS